MVQLATLRVIQIQKCAHAHAIHKERNKPTSYQVNVPTIKRGIGSSIGLIFTSDLLLNSSKGQKH